MAGSGRTFSFGDHDEEALRGQSDYRTIHPSLLPTHTDSPTRQYDIPPAPPQHRIDPSYTYTLPPLDTRASNGYALDHSTSVRTTSTITPGADNLGQSAAGGGIAGVAWGIANTHPRKSGMEAIPHTSSDSLDRGGADIPSEREHDIVSSDMPYTPSASDRKSQARDPFASPAPSRRSDPFDDKHRHSNLPPSPEQSTSRALESRNSRHMAGYPPNSRQSSYMDIDNPYNRFSTAWDPRVARGDIDPNAIDDDGDDGMMPSSGQRRSAFVASTHEGALSGGATAYSGMLGAFRGLLGGRNKRKANSRDASGNYGPVGGLQMDESAAEKSLWLNKQTSGRKKLRWMVGLLAGLVLIGAIVGGIIGGLHRGGSSGSDQSTQGKSAAQDDDSGDLTKDSAEIKKLLGNPNLHKVFPGMDYTPFNAQYPACLTNPPSQNNVTRDVAVLSQLTNTIRLYGTDCNQTEMVLHAIKKLALIDMKVWLGVWLDSNQTSTDRGLSAMYTILDENGADPFAGVIVGNEVLYRKDMSSTQLADILIGVKKNFTSKPDLAKLPVATSDLGDSWTSSLASSVDVVMSNIHPFFAGVEVSGAAGWTWTFWQNKDTALTKGTSQQNIISEVGWPSGGGTDCGQAGDTCVGGSVAGINEMNQFMGDFICQSLANGTNFFWFEAFDEPWKVSLNTPGKEWEDKWGLMDPGRNLKPGLKIPDCGTKDLPS